MTGEGERKANLVWTAVVDAARRAATEGATGSASRLQVGGASRGRDRTINKQPDVPILFWDRSSAMPESSEPSEAEVDAVVAEFGGDLRAAVRALLHDLAVLAADFRQSVSRGYVRGRTAMGVRQGGERQ